jgi:hypothetical protein
MPFLGSAEHDQAVAKRGSHCGPMILFVSTLVVTIVSIIIFAAAISILISNDLNLGITACQILLIITVSGSLPHQGVC